MSDWFQKFAESYSGSGDIDQHNVADGSETYNSEMETPYGSGGVQRDNEYQPAMMPMSLDVHDSANSKATKDKPNTSDSNEFSDFPFGEGAVDDNHANVVVSASFNGLSSDDSVAGGGANFTHHAPDSPEILNDGHPIEELENNQQGINYVSNTDAPHVSGPAKDMILDDPEIVGKNQYQNIPEINKGRDYSYARLITTLNPFARTASDMDGWDTGSNVDDIEYPDEIGIKHDRATHDFGTGDQSGDNTRMDANPMQGYSGTEEESKLYSGIVSSNSMGDAFLNDYLKKVFAKTGKMPCGKCGKTDYNDIRGRCCDKCAFPKQADYGPVVPNVNPNSGNDDEDDVYPGVILPQPAAMTDGKIQDTSIPEKDPNWVQQKGLPKYKKVQDDFDGKDNYFQYINTGGGFGGEGGGDFSGVVPSGS